MSDKKILIGSPVRQSPNVLNEFLKGLEETDKSDFLITYYFVDDNVDEKSSELLNSFSEKYDVVIQKGADLVSVNEFSEYVVNDETHFWDSSIIRKVAFFKDSIIEYAIANSFDYLFFVDSDIVVDKRTLQHLINRNVEIVSNVFWTQWRPNWELEPQCFWIPALNSQTKGPFSGLIDIEVARQVRRDFFAKMRIPGLYKVDGLGACTMIKSSALKKGVRFKEIPNLSIQGEDRHFCIRAGALGIELFFDTVYPVYHIYREEYLNRVDEFKKEGFKYDMCQTFVSQDIPKNKKSNEVLRLLKKAGSYIGRKIGSKIKRKTNPPISFRKSLNDNRIVSLINVNDSNVQYLSKTLESIKKISNYCIIYDGVQAGVNRDLIDLEKFHICTQPISDGFVFRHLWKEAQAFNPSWILALNSGEILDEKLKEGIPYLVRNVSIDVYRFINDRQMYRQTESDKNIQYAPYLMRYENIDKFKWNEPESKFPNQVDTLRHAKIDFKVLDYRNE